jgi:hypothetical protein
MMEGRPHPVEDDRKSVSGPGEELFKEREEASGGQT